MKKIMTLKEILAIGGKISIYKNGKTNLISLTNLLKKININFEKDKEIKLCYLRYSKVPRIQAIYEILNPDDENSELKEIYNKLNEI